jgi:hypothetical protein
MGQYPNLKSMRKINVHAVAEDDPRFLDLLGRMNLPH